MLFFGTFRKLRPERFPNKSHTVRNGAVVVGVGSDAEFASSFNSQTRPAGINFQFLPARSRDSEMRILQSCKDISGAGSTHLHFS